MKKRAGLARAMALDHEILFFDEPSAGLDPISAHLLDKLIIELRDSLGAIFLVVAAIVVFGSGRFFTSVQKRVMFFEGSVKGLQIGAPVVVRGVQIGHVTDILLEVNKRDLTAFIPVYIEVYPQKIVPIGDDHSFDQRFLQALIKKGLRAQLQIQSFITGKLMVNLDFYPETTIRLVGLEKRYSEIPTISSGLEQLTKSLEELPLKEMAGRLNETLAGINRLVNSRDLQDSEGFDKVKFDHFEHIFNIILEVAK